MSTAAVNLLEEYQRTFPQSAELYERAKQVFPDGVTHDGRYLQPFPPFVESARGAVKRTVEGVELIDYWVGHGSLLLGHSDPEMVAAVSEQVAKGTHFGASHELEVRWAERICSLIPCAERVRFTNSGTEATLMALRLSRLITGRPKVLKIAGHFHGWHDQLAPGADPPHDDLRYPTPGVPEQVLDQLVVVKPNDLDALAATIERHRPACVIMEGTGGRWGVVPFASGYVEGVREITRSTGTLFIMDEVITGFRVSPGGAQQHYGVTPDLTSLAKIVAGGLPGGCLVGRAELMEAISTENRYGRKMKHPGTYNGNPLSSVAGIAMLDRVATSALCEQANAAGVQLRNRLNELFVQQGVNWVAYGEFSLTHILPNYDGPRPTGEGFVPYEGNFDRLDRPIDRKLVHAFRCATLLGGVDCMGMGLITSAAHGPEEIDRTVSGFAEAVNSLRTSGMLE